jgi:hypothetical protein
MSEKDDDPSNIDGLWDAIFEDYDDCVCGMPISRDEKYCFSCGAENLLFSIEFHEEKRGKGSYERNLENCRNNHTGFSEEFLRGEKGVYCPHCGRRFLHSIN